MDALSSEAMYTNMTRKSPYDPEPASDRPRSRIVRAGMSVVEMVVWIVIMAVLAIGMIALLWNVSK